MIVYVNYRLPNGELGGYMATNITASDDRMTFDWTILKGVTQYKGEIAFLVCIKKTNAEGLEENHWNSELCTDMYISEGLETIEQVMSDYPDLVNQLLERMAECADIDGAFTETVPFSCAAVCNINGTHNNTAVNIKAAENNTFLLLFRLGITFSFGQVIANRIIFVRRRDYYFLSRLIPRPCLPCPHFFPWQRVP
jgi:hypothetical protein